jgi:translation initiation factor IF-1
MSENLVVEGIVEEALPNTLFRVRIASGEEVLSYLAGKMRLNRIKVLVGDRGSPITFGITGSGTFIWEVKPEAFAAELAGKSASMFKTVLEAHPEIAEGSARIRPFWKKTFPADTESIHVTVTEAK